VLNYMNWESPDPGPEARANLKRFVAEGKGLVLVHFACGAFQGWPEFTQIAGRVYNPALRPHDPYGRFTVVIADADHPVKAAWSASCGRSSGRTPSTGSRPRRLIGTSPDRP
jgi:uncharacterized protein